MKLRTKILIVVASVIVYIHIGQLFAYHAMYAKYFPKSTTAKILAPFSPLTPGPFNSNTSEVNVSLQKKYGNFTTYHQKCLDKHLIMIIWPMVVVAFYVIALFSWIASGVYWVITGELLRWLVLLP